MPIVPSSGVPESLDGIGIDSIARFFHKSVDYESGYRERHDCHSVDKAVRSYKSHRKGSLAEGQPP